MSGTKIMTEHHRLPRSLGGKSVPENISIVESKKHQAWHILFRNLTVEAIVAIINKKWIDPQWELVLRKRRPKQRR